MNAIDIAMPPTHPVTCIALQVAGYRGVRYVDLISARRTADVVGPRQETMYLAKTLTGLSYPAIGRRIGARDHTTVLHGVRMIERRMAERAVYAEEVESLAAFIGPTVGESFRPTTDIAVMTIARRLRASDHRSEVRSVAAALIAAAAEIYELQTCLAVARQAVTCSPAAAADPDPTPMASPDPATDPDTWAAARAVAKAERAYRQSIYCAEERPARIARDRAVADLTKLIEKDKNHDRNI